MLASLLYLKNLINCGIIVLLFMKIYFAGSIRGGRTDKELYLEIIQLLTKYGKVLTEHIGDPALSSMGEDGPNDQYIYKRDLKWLTSADVIVAEVTTPSLGVGYEIGKSETMKKPLLCLYRPSDGKKLSAMIAGNNHLTVKEYTNINNIKEILKDFFQTLPHSK